MTDKIRDECIAPELTDHCTESDLCAACWTQRDVEENPELYEALAGTREE